MNKEAIKEAVKVDLRSRVLYTEASSEEKKKIEQASDIAIDICFMKFINAVIRQRNTYKEEADTMEAEFQTINSILKKYENTI